jgi:hypothetical protein
MYQKTRHGPEDFVLPIALLFIVLILVSPPTMTGLMKIGLVGLAVCFATLVISTGVRSIGGKSR